MNTLELEKYKKYYNMLSTLSASINEMCNNSFNEIDIDTSNSITFYDLILTFNNLYQEFKQHLSTLPNLNIGTGITFLSMESIDDRIIFIELNVEKSNTCLDDDFDIRLIYKNGIYYHQILKEKGQHDEEKSNKIYINPAIIKDYVDLAKEYEPLLKAYSYLKNAFIYGNGSTTLFSTITGDIMQELNEFKLAFGTNFRNGEIHFNITFDLAKDLKRNIDKDEIIINCQKQTKNTQETINHLLNTLYINRKLLPEMYSLTKQKKLLK